MSAGRATREWASAVTEGWVDLAELTFVDHGDRPSCGLGGCRHRARWVDPSGDGWCQLHRDQGLHGEPPSRNPRTTRRTTR